MAALDNGPGCDGLVFRIEQDKIEEETEILWRREQVGPAYIAMFVETVVSGQRLDALAFVADCDAELIDVDLTRDEQIRCVATGVGFMGSSLDYLRGIDQKFAALGIQDNEVTSLLRGAEDLVRATTAEAQNG